MTRGWSRSCANWRAASRIMRSSGLSCSSSRKGSSQLKLALAGASLGFGCGTALMKRLPLLELKKVEAPAETLSSLEFRSQIDVELHPLGERQLAAVVQ